MSVMRVTFGDISAILAVGGVLLVPVLIGGAAGSDLEGVAGAGTTGVDVIRADPLRASNSARRSPSAGVGRARPVVRASARRASRPGASTSAQTRRVPPAPALRAPIGSRSATPRQAAPTNSASRPASPTSPSPPPPPPPVAFAAPPPPLPPLPPPLPPIPPPPPPPIGLLPPPPLPPLPPVPPLPPLPPLPLDSPKLPVP